MQLCQNLGTSFFNSNFYNHGTEMEKELTNLTESIEKDVNYLNTKIEREVLSLNERIESEVMRLNTSMESEMVRLTARMDRQVSCLNQRLDKQVAKILQTQIIRLSRETFLWKKLFDRVKIVMLKVQVSIKSCSEKPLEISSKSFQYF